MPPKAIFLYIKILFRQGAKKQVRGWGRAGFINKYLSDIYLTRSGGKI